MARPVARSVKHPDDQHMRPVNAVEHHVLASTAFPVEALAEQRDTSMIRELGSVSNGGAKRLLIPFGLRRPIFARRVEPDANQIAVGCST